MTKWRLALRPTDLVTHKLIPNSPFFGYESLLPTLAVMILWICSTFISITATPQLTCDDCDYDDDVSKKLWTHFSCWDVRCHVYMGILLEIKYNFITTYNEYDDWKTCWREEDRHSYHSLHREAIKCDEKII